MCPKPHATQEPPTRTADLSLNFRLLGLPDSVMMNQFVCAFSPLNHNGLHRGQKHTLINFLERKKVRRMGQQTEKQDKTQQWEQASRQKNKDLSGWAQLHRLVEQRTSSSLILWICRQPYLGGPSWTGWQNRGPAIPWFSGSADNPIWDGPRFIGMQDSGRVHGFSGAANSPVGDGP